MRTLSRSRWKPCAGICMDGDGGRECSQGRKQRWGWEEGPRELIPTGWSVSKGNRPQENCWLENLPTAENLPSWKPAERLIIRNSSPHRKCILPASPTKICLYWFLSQALKKNSDKARPLCLSTSPLTSVQFSSAAQPCPTLCDPMNRSTPGLPVHHQLLEFTQTHVHWVSDAIQPSHPLSSPSPPAPKSLHW